MSKKKWNDEDIEKTLTKLPPVKDRQSKEDLYQAIQRRSDTAALSRSTKKRKKPWVFPAVGSAAAIFIILLVIPSFLNNDSQTSMDDAGNIQQNSEMSTFDDAAEDSDEGNYNVEEDNASNDNAETSEEAGDGDDASMYNESDSEADEESADITEAPEGSESNEEIEERMVEEVEILSASVPVVQILSQEESGLSFDIAILSSADVSGELSIEDAIMTSLQDSNIGTRDVLGGLQEVSYDEDAPESVSLDFSEDHELASLSAAESSGVEMLFEELFTVYGIEEVELTVEGEPGVQFGQEGVLDSRTVESFNRGYYSYELDGETYLVSARAAGEQMRTNSGQALNYQETVERMASAPSDEWYRSPVPEFVEVADIQFGDRYVHVIFESDDDNAVSELTEEMATFYEALRLTAEPFSIDTLHVTNDNTGETKEFDLSEDRF